MTSRVVIHGPAHASSMLAKKLLKEMVTIEELDLDVPARPLPPRKRMTLTPGQKVKRRMGYGFLLRHQKRKILQKRGG